MYCLMGGRTDGRTDGKVIVRKVIFKISAVASNKSTLHTSCFLLLIIFSVIIHLERSILIEKKWHGTPSSETLKQFAYCHSPKVKLALSLRYLGHNNLIVRGKPNSESQY